LLQSKRLLSSMEGDYTMLNRVVCWLWVGLAFAIATPCALASGGESEAVSLNPLSLEWIEKDLAIWTAVVFLLLLAVLTKFAWKPIMEGLDKREQNVADQIAQAEAANQKANDLLADYDRKLASAQEQVRAILDQGRRDAEQVGRELLDKAKEEAQAEHQRAMQQIDAAANAAIKELADQSATLAVDLAGKIVRSKLTPGDHSRLIEDAVAGFAQNKNYAGKN
jgi:F-type H+-transporting ATPase subunit b